MKANASLPYHDRFFLRLVEGVKRLFQRDLVNKYRGERKNTAHSRRDAFLDKSLLQAHYLKLAKVTSHQGNHRTSPFSS